MWVGRSDPCDTIASIISVTNPGACAAIPGIVASVLGARVTLTDVEQVLPLLNLNVKRNEPLFPTRPGPANAFLLGAATHLALTALSVCVVACSGSPTELVPAPGDAHMAVRTLQLLRRHHRRRHHVLSGDSQRPGVQTPHHAKARGLTHEYIQQTTVIDMASSSHTLVLLAHEHRKVWFP